MTKKPGLNDPDKAAFDEAMKGVKRLVQPKINPLQPPKLAVKTRPKSETSNFDIFQFSDYEKYEAIDSNTLIEFYRSGLQHKMIHRMRTGNFEIEAKLDLHGLNVEQAREALARFLLECQQQKIRQVLIIHGKGRANQVPVLKNKLNHWLRQAHDILAFCSAKSKEGGTGAIYVLLRNVTY